MIRCATFLARLLYFYLCLHVHTVRHRARRRFVMRRPSAFIADAAVRIDTGSFRRRLRASDSLIRPQRLSTSTSACSLVTFSTNFLLHERSTLHHFVYIHKKIINNIKNNNIRDKNWGASSDAPATGPEICLANPIRHITRRVSPHPCALDVISHNVILEPRSPPSLPRAP